MRNWMRNLGITKLAFATLDELSTHLLPAGGLIEEIVVQVRRPVVGTAKLVLSGAAGVAPLPLVGTQTVDAATDATALTTGTSGTETDLTPTYTVDLSKEGWSKKLVRNAPRSGLDFGQLSPHRTNTSLIARTQPPKFRYLHAMIPNVGCQLFRSRHRLLNARNNVNLYPSQTGEAL